VIVKYSAGISFDSEEWYEERGFVPKYISVRDIHDAESGRIAIYYGAADSYVGLAFTTVDEWCVTSATAAF
jgi:beta-1,4-mannooligosaccharide/beta-1,4-mannosyl-N-acetylglucosamine phosphorylase